jgi:hypothetical protein
LPNPGTADAAWLTILPSPGVGTYSGPANTHTLSVTANPGNSERSATITVTSGRLEKKITVRQKGVGFEVSGFLASYPANGNVATPPKVRSSYPWCVNVKSDPDAIIQTFTASGTGTGNDETFTFTLKNNTSMYTGSISTAILEFFSPTSEFETEERIIKLPGGQSTPSTHKGWAGSNIYWDNTNQRLTFDEATTHQNYQGVLFKWGSLVGLDPATVSSWPNSSANTNRVYIPDYDSATPTNSTWTNPTAYAAGYAAWDAIPYADANYVGNINASNRAILYEITTPANVANRRGDICRYLTETGAAPGLLTGTRWRMPTKGEFGTSGNYSGWTSGSVSGLNSAGTGTITSGRTKTGGNPSGSINPFFPAVGTRYAGTLDNVGIGPFPWSSSPSGSSTAWGPDFGSSLSLDSNDDRTLGQFVRCVKE